MVSFFSGPRLCLNVSSACFCSVVLMSVSHLERGLLSVRSWCSDSRFQSNLTLVVIRLVPASRISFRHSNEQTIETPTEVTWLIPGQQVRSGPGTH